MILYLHGFGSCANSNKTKILKSHFLDFYAPGLPENPKETISKIESLINPKTMLIGSSLGGYYAIYFAVKYNLKAVLINPSLNHIKL